MCESDVFPLTVGLMPTRTTCGPQPTRLSWTSSSTVPRWATNCCWVLIGYLLELNPLALKHWLPLLSSPSVCFENEEWRFRFTFTSSHSFNQKASFSPFLWIFPLLLVEANLTGLLHQWKALKCKPSRAYHSTACLYYNGRPSRIL